MDLILIVFGLIIIILIGIIFKYQRQMKDICRQLSFLKEHDSNMMISGDIRFGSFGKLLDSINEFVELRKQERKKYFDKEKIISDTYTNLSHDIRTPLTSLDGYFQLLEESKDIQEQKKYITVIQERITSLKDMLEELFTFTKLKNDSYILELNPLSLNRLLKETLFSYYDNWKANGIEPEFHITDEPLMINGNAQAMKRVIRNIIKNGLDHGEKQFRVLLEKRRNTVVLCLNNMVANSEKIDIEQVFERFYKADEARSESSTGLGLSIAREFVIRMNGEISAHIYEDWFCVTIVFPIEKDA